MTESPALFTAYEGLRFDAGHWGDNNDEANAELSNAPARTYNGRFCDITQTWHSEKEPGDCDLTGEIATSKQVTNRRFGHYSFLLRRNVYPSSSGKKSELQLEIQSNFLQDVFRSVCRPVRSLNLQANPILVKAPYHELYHFRDDILKTARATARVLSSAEREQAETEIRALRRFINDHLGDAIAEIDALVSIKQISLETLWAIYKPGGLVLLSRLKDKSGSETRCGILQQYTTKQSTNGSLSCVVKIRYMSFEGGRFGVVEQDIEFQPPAGNQAITMLPVYPIFYSTEQDKIIQNLTKCGRTFIDLCRTPMGDGIPTHLSYHGPVWIQRRRYETSGCNFLDPPERTICGRVMVDPEGYVAEHTMFRERVVASTLTHDQEAPDALREVNLDALSPDELITFPSRIAGYSLVTKDAGFFQVDAFAPIDWDEARAENMRQSSDKMRSVLRIASGFSFISQQFNYEIDRKGRGLVALLYGLSGTGKTLTAECVAEVLHLPLYRVSGGDLGGTISDAEKNLVQAFDRTSRWWAILLFDEADAFMAKRNGDDMVRDAMVCTLLRLLEYQSGIVILTTNRRKDFDPAFFSRIHISVEYGALTTIEKEFIWRTELDMARKGGLAHALSAPDIQKLSQLEMDGRTIKNTVNVLQLYLADDERKSRTGLSEIKEVLEIATGNLEGDARKQVIDFCRAVESANV